MRVGGEKTWPRWEMSEGLVWLIIVGLFLRSEKSINLMELCFVASDIRKRAPWRREWSAFHKAPAPRLGLFHWDIPQLYPIPIETHVWAGPWRNRTNWSILCLWLPIFFLFLFLFMAIGYLISSFKFLLKVGAAGRNGIKKRREWDKTADKKQKGDGFLLIDKKLSSET